jgi:serine/threonine protein phosphatase PrpC
LSNWKQLSPSIYHSLSMGPAFGITDVGLVRPSNEDNFLIDAALDLLIVGDGMGGHDGGEIASASALNAIRDCVRASDAAAARAPPPALDDDPDATWSDAKMPAVKALFDAVEFANARLYAQNLANHYGEGRGMGTTVTGLWRCRDQPLLVVFHVGDSRLYRHRAGKLSILTRDQTMYQQAIDSGAVDHLPPRNLLLQAVGPGASVKPVVRAYPYQAGDVYLLCSDGLHGDAPFDAIEAILQGTRGQTLEQSCEALIALAKAHGSRDNITALLLLCER